MLREFYLIFFLKAWEEELSRSVKICPTIWRVYITEQSPTPKAGSPLWWNILLIPREHLPASQRRGAFAPHPAMQQLPNWNQSVEKSGQIQGHFRTVSLALSLWTTKQNLHLKGSRSGLPGNEGGQVCVWKPLQEIPLVLDSSGPLTEFFSQSSCPRIHYF